MTSLEDCFARVEACPYADPIDAALYAGWAADRLGYAFVGGYEAALRALLLGAGVRLRSKRVSLAATESGGAHPRAIETRLVGFDRSDGELRLRGEKTFATLASASETLLVVASRGVGDDGKNRLSLVQVDRSAEGVTIEDRPTVAFAPEIPHARVKLDDVAVRAEDVLPGDGYSSYLKPFRTIEDIHVLAACLAHLVRASRLYRFDSAVTEGALALASALRDLARRNPSASETHLALSGSLRATRRLIAESDAEWDKADETSRERWRRDLGLLVVADNARNKRTEAAWTAISDTTRSSSS
jgi:acyl-CoA dehydrogenase